MRKVLLKLSTEESMVLVAQNIPSLTYISSLVDSTGQRNREMYGSREGQFHSIPQPAVSVNLTGCGMWDVELCNPHPATIA